MICHGKDYKLLKNLNLLNESSLRLNRQDQFSTLRFDLQKHLDKAYEKNEQSYNLRSRPRSFQVGDEVIKRNFALSNAADHFNAKLAPVGIKVRVKQRLGNSLYLLEDLNGKELGTYHAKDIW